MIKTEGFEIIRGVFCAEEITKFQDEANTIARSSDSICLRHIRNKSEMFKQLAISESILNLLPKPMSPVRSILFDKTAEENWPVPWHQDLTIAVKEKKEVTGYGPWSMKDGSVHVQPPVTLLSKMITVRIHLDDTPPSNGALRVIPKSSEYGKIDTSEVRKHINETEVICECAAGDVLLMSPLILHSSKRSEKIRKDQKRSEKIRKAE